MHEVHVNMFSLTSIYGVNLLNTLLELTLFWRQILLCFAGWLVVVICVVNPISIREI